MGKINDGFRKFSSWSSERFGSPWAFGITCIICAGWGLAGPFFHWSDTWQLTLNTVGSVVTFLMVFLIQNTQNRDARAMHLKLDELIRAKRHARDEFMDLEDASDEEIRAFREEFKKLKRERRLPPDVTRM